MVNGTKLPKGDKNVNIKILLKEVIQKIIGNKNRVRIYNSEFEQK